MIGHTNVNTRNTAYRVGTLTVDAVDTATYLPSDYGLDYFDRVDTTLSVDNPFYEICVGHNITFSAADVGTEPLEIPAYLFYRQTRLYEINMPSGITSIGTYAFYNTGVRVLHLYCPNLTFVGVSAFQSNKMLMRVYINAPNLQNINDMFVGCEKIYAAYIEAMPSMYTRMFSGIYRIEYCEIGEGVAAMAENVFYLPPGSFTAAYNFHILFFRQKIVDEHGNVVQDVPAMHANAIGDRPVAKTFIHVPLNSLCAYRVRISEGSGNARYYDLVAPFVEAEVGDVLPTSLTQTSEEHVGNYTLEWYSDYAYNNIMTSNIVSAKGRYFAKVLAGSET